MAQGPSVALLNKRLRQIYENEGMEYGNDTNDPVELERRRVEVNRITKENIRFVLSKVKKAKNVDFCFLLDATGSMSSHIKGVKQSVTKIFKTLMRSRDNPGGIEKLRIAIVVYRDFCDDEKLKIYPFTEDESECMKNCNEIVAIDGSGGDGAEDVFGGLQAAINLQWSASAATRIIFHICDAPCHGKQFHDGAVTDDYPDGDPKGRTVEDLFRKLESKNILYHFGKITSATDKMIDEFSKAYREFISTFDVKDVISIEGSVITSISTSVTSSIAAIRETDSNEEKVELDKNEPDWSSLNSEQFECITFALPELVDDILEKEPNKSTLTLEVKLAPSPFAAGAERHVRMALLTGMAKQVLQPMSDLWLLSECESGLKVAIKRAKREKVSAEGEFITCQTSAEVQGIASFLAKEYNKALGKNNLLRFLPASVLSCKSDASVIFSCEPLFSKSKKFIKFTNNFDFGLERLSESDISSELIDTVQAFSHWTWCETDRDLIVTDLQGWVCDLDGEKCILLTDPGIHCDQKERFGTTNLGKDGINAFFKSHICNSICTELKLVVPKWLSRAA